MLGTYTHKDAHTADATDSHPSTPLLPIRLAFSLSLFFGIFCIFIRLQIFFSPPKARHRAVQTPTQERNSRQRSAHHIKILMQGRERGGREGTQLGNLSAASPLLFAQLSFRVSFCLSFFLDVLGGTKCPARLLRQAEPSSPVLRTWLSISPLEFGGTTPG
ncbi:hypothetical protein V8C34DRAFT_289313 [Trichoderma compactum]